MGATVAPTEDEDGTTEAVAGVIDQDIDPSWESTRFGGLSSKRERVRDVI